MHSATFGTTNRRCNIFSFIKKIIGQPRRRGKKTSAKPAIDEKFIIPRANHSIPQDDISINAIKVLKRLQAGGYDAFLVGGGVRDLLLRHTAKDFDIATNARPEQIKKLFRNCRLIGRRFRLAHIHFGRDIIEVATFRGTEATHHTQRQMEAGMIIRDNVYGKLEDDVWRRDFTINALYYNIVDASIIDLSGGFADIKNKILRLIGDPVVRYQEDPVRMLRGIRFAAKLGFQFDPATEQPIATMRDLLEKVPDARLLIEIEKLFHSGHGYNSFTLLRKYQLFEKLFPETSKLLDNNAYPGMQALLETTLKNTDARILDDKPVTPAFLFAALLWHPLQDEVDKLKDSCEHPLQAVEIGMTNVLQRQQQSLLLPKRMTAMVKEIWILQYRLPRRYGKQPLRTLNHPRFRAAYDFMTLRAAIGEVKQELVDWWSAFQYADGETKEKMLQSRHPRPRKAKTE